MHRSPGICLTAEENPRKPQLGDRLMKGLCDQSSPQMGPLSPNEVGRIAQHVRIGKEGIKERTGEIKQLHFTELWIQCLVHLHICEICS